MEAREQDAMPTVRSACALSAAAPPPVRLGVADARLAATSDPHPHDKPCRPCRRSVARLGPRAPCWTRGSEAIGRRSRRRAGDAGPGLDLKAARSSFRPTRGRRSPSRSGSAGRHVAREWGRIERGELREVSLDQLARAGSAVGLKLWARLYPDGDPIRDAAHARLLERLRACVKPPLLWRPEVPLPDGSDRAWDSVDRAAGPVRRGRGGDAHHRWPATWRRAQAGACRRSRIGHMILLVADTRNNRRVLALIRESLRDELPLDTRADPPSAPIGSPRRVASSSCDPRQRHLARSAVDQRRKR